MLYEWYGDPLTSLDRPRWPTKAACLIGYRTLRLFFTCPGEGVIPNEEDAEEAKEGEEGLEEEARAATRSEKEKPQRIRISESEPQKEGRRRRGGCLLALRLCSCADASPVWTTSRGLQLRGWRSGFLLFVNLCMNVHNAAEKNNVIAEHGNGEEERSGARCWNILAAFNAHTNAWLLTKGDDEMAGWMDCGARGAVRGGRVLGTSMLRTAQGTHSHDHDYTIPLTLCCARQHWYIFSLRARGMTCVETCDSPLTRDAMCDHMLGDCLPPDGRWHGPCFSKPLHQPTSWAPPRIAEGGEEESACGLPPPLTLATMLVGGGGIGITMGGMTMSTGRIDMGSGRCSVRRPANDSVMTDGSGLVGPWRCGDSSGYVQGGAAGGLGLDGIGGLHADVCAADELAATGLRSDGGGPFLGYAGMLIYVAWVVSAFIAFSGDDLWDCPNKERRRRRRRTTRGLAHERCSSERPRKLAWIAVAPPFVGRRRLCRTRPIKGRRWAIRLGGQRTHGRRGRPQSCRRDAQNARSSGRRRGADAGVRAAADTPGARPVDVACQRRTAADACRGALGTLTVGQAGNPGPPGKLQWLSSAVASAVAYARPGKAGFYGLRSAGYLESDCPPSSPFALKLATANTTGWRPLQEFLSSTSANVIFAQEHRLFAEAIPAASAWARKRGWKTVWAPARKGVGGGACAGTVILAREYIGLRHPDRGAAIVTDGHTVAAVVEPPSCRPFIGYSAYYHNGQGLSRANLDLTAAIGSHWEAQADDKLQMIIGADFNMRPELFARAGLARKIWGRIVAPVNPRGTCRTRSGAATIDYFYMSAALADLVEEVVPIEGTGVRTHTPVQATFVPRLAALKALSIRAPPSLPLEEVFGPRPPPPRWQALKDIVEELVAFVREEGDYDRADQMLTDVYAMWMDMAEHELADITGTKLAKRGCRATGPTMRWKSLLPEVDRTPKPSGAAAMAWIADIARDATRVPRARRGDEDVCGDELVILLKMALKEDVLGKDTVREGGYLERMGGLLDRAADICRMNGDMQAAQWTGWSVELEDLLEALGQEHRRRTAGESAEKTRAWRDWVREGFEKGAKNAHAFLRLPAEWRPTTTEDVLGLPTADPAQILDGQRRKFVAAWNADDDCGRYVWEERDALPRLLPSQLREASKSFKKGTAIAYDGVHVRHYSMLCDGALEVLGAILETCELLGTLPKQCRLVVTPLLEKPKGGFRPVSIYVSLYRLWTKARKHVTAEWEAAHPRAYFSAAKGNGPVDTTWRQAVRQEARLNANGAAACLFWDLEAFYESIDRERLVARAEASAFPMPVLRLALSMYSAPRMVSMNGRIARETWPKRGVGAGCGLANTLVKIYTIAPMDEFVARLPESVNVDLHVDDFALECVGDDERQVARDLATAQALLHEMVLRDLGASVSVPKAAMVASTSSLAHRVREAVGTLAGPIRQAAPNLGIDAAAAKRRGANSTGGLRQTRWRQAAARRRRLRALASAIGVRAGKVFVAGVGASATYHAAVQGLTDVEALRVRRLASAALPPRSRFRSLTLTHLYFDMPTASAEVAATLQYARAVWNATLLGPSRPRHPGFDLPGIREAWDTVADNVAEYIDPEHPEPKKRRRWGRARGPLATSMLELHRIGWSPNGPFDWTDDLGSKVILTETTPALLKSLLVASVRRQAERAVGAKWARDDATFAGKRVCIDAAVDAVKRSRSLTPLQKGAFRSVLLEGVLTKNKARRFGYDVDDVCDLCGATGDTVHHRTYKCPFTEPLVRSAVPDWFWQEAQRSSAADKFWVTASMPHPADMVPRPRSDYLSWAHDADGCRCDDASMSGHVFFDGSCSTSVFRGLQRASMALVQVGGDARPIKTVSVPIWSTLPQTSQVAEYVAFAGLSHVLNGSTAAYGDCKGVLEHAAMDPTRRFDGRRKHAGILMSMGKYPQGLANIARTIKVKAHQHVESITDPDEKWRAIGNELADAAAKEALKRHPQPSADVAAQIAFWEARARLVVKAVAIAMSQFPPLGGKLTRRARAPRLGTAPAGEVDHPVHQWQHAGGRWRCATCWTFIVGDGGVPAARRREPCRRLRVPMQQEEFVKAGHVMMQTEGDLPVTFCARCGGWSSRRANRLNKPCGPPSAAGKMALRRIEKGWHPWQARDGKTGKCLPRGKLKIKRGPMRERTGRDREDVLKVEARPRTDGGPPLIETCAEMPVPMEHDDDLDVFGHGGGFDEVSDHCMGLPEGEGCIAAGPVEAPPGNEDVARPAQTRADGGAEEALKGSTMRMLLATLKDAPSRLSMDHEVAVFNATSGVVVTASLRAVQSEMLRLRAMGVCDEDAAGVATRCEARDRGGERGDEGGRTRAEACSADTVMLRAEPRAAFTCRQSLLQHLVQAKGASSCKGHRGDAERGDQAGDAGPTLPADSAVGLEKRRKIGTTAGHDDNCAARGSTAVGSSTVHPGGGYGGDGVRFGSRDELRRHLLRDDAARRGDERGRQGPAACRAEGCGTKRSHEAMAEGCRREKCAEAAGAVNSTIGAREGPGGTHGGMSTVAVAQGPYPGATATVLPKWGAALLTKEGLAARPPSGRVAPLDGTEEGAREKRPLSTSLQAWPSRLGAGPSNNGQVERDEEGAGPPRGESEEAGGTKVPRSLASVARGDGDATAPRSVEEPRRGSTLCTLGALRECSDTRTRELRTQHGGAWPGGQGDQAGTVKADLVDIGGHGGARHASASAGDLYDGGGLQAAMLDQLRAHADGPPGHRGSHRLDPPGNHLLGQGRAVQWDRLHRPRGERGSRFRAGADAAVDRLPSALVVRAPGGRGSGQGCALPPAEERACDAGSGRAPGQGARLRTWLEEGDGRNAKRARESCLGSDVSRRVGGLCVQPEEVADGAACSARGLGGGGARGESCADGAHAGPVHGRFRGDDDARGGERMDTPHPSPALGCEVDVHDVTPSTGSAAAPGALGLREGRPPGGSSTDGIRAAAAAAFDMG